MPPQSAAVGTVLAPASSLMAARSEGGRMTITVRFSRSGFRGICALAALTAAGAFAGVSLAAATNTVPPAISGSAVQGQTLKVSRGTWSGTGTIKYLYRWQRCDAAGATCVDIKGVHKNTYALAAADVGSTVRGVVTATDTTGPPAEAPSATTAVVTTLSTTPPTITGTPTAGQTLTAVEGTFSGANPTYTYQWQRCDAAGATCNVVPTVVTKTYVLTAADLGATLRVLVTSTNTSGSTSAISAPTPVITSGGPASLVKLANGKMSIAAADVAGSERLILSSFKVNTTLPIRSRKAFTVTLSVTDTRGYAVRDALVYLIGLPYGRILQVPEHKTGQDGRVSFTLVPTKLQPLKGGARLVIFARARVEGQKILTGASSRRLFEIAFSA
jgi:fibronectin type 3 domain-containing protein